MNTITLNNGAKIPQLGLGTYNNGTDECAKEMVEFALKNGYTHVDTAHAYMVERGVGQGIKASGVKREDIWLTSKLWPSEYGEGKTLEALDKMLKRLDTDYLDLVYLHMPTGDLAGAWKDLEKAVAMGKVRTLGLSDTDYDMKTFDQVMAVATIKPAIFQVELHPFWQQKEIRKLAEQYDMAVECWFPLGGRDFGLKTLLADPTLNEIGAAHGKTAAQVAIRWSLQRGLIVIPGSVKTEHIAENFAVFDFELSEAEMARIDALESARFFPQPDEAMLAGMDQFAMPD